MKSNERPTALGKYAPKVEFLAVQDKVNEFIKEGYSTKSIHTFFTEKKAFTMSYATFCRYLRKNIDKDRIKRKPAQQIEKIEKKELRSVPSVFSSAKKEFTKDTIEKNELI